MRFDRARSTRKRHERARPRRWRYQTDARRIKRRRGTPIGRLYKYQQSWRRECFVNIDRYSCGSRGLEEKKRRWISQILCTHETKDAHFESLLSNDWSTTARLVETAGIPEGRCVRLVSGETLAHRLYGKPAKCSVCVSIEPGFMLEQISYRVYDRTLCLFVSMFSLSVDPRARLFTNFSKSTISWNIYIGCESDTFGRKLDFIQFNRSLKYLWFPRWFESIHRYVIQKHVANVEKIRWEI